MLIQCRQRGCFKILRNIIALKALPTPSSSSSSSSRLLIGSNSVMKLLTTNTCEAILVCKESPHVLLKDCLVAAVLRKTPIVFVSNAMKELCALLGLKRVSCIGIRSGKSSDHYGSGSKVSVGENSDERIAEEDEEDKKKGMIKEEEGDEVKEDSLAPSKQSQEGIEEDMRCATLDALSEYIRDKAR